VAATAGICILARPLAAALPGPRRLARAFAVTTASQIGVAPIAATVFGGLPVAALPANVLAEPAAAGVLVWGLPAGLVAELVGGLPARVLQWPTDLFVGWIATVARTTGTLPLGELGSTELLAVSLLVVAAVTAHRAGRPTLRRLLLVASLVSLGVPAWRIAHPPSQTPIEGATVWRDGATVLVLDSGARGPAVLDDLRRAGVRRIDLAVAPRGGLGEASVLALVRTRISIGAVLAPEGNQVRGATVAQAGDRWQAGGLAVTIEADRPRLGVGVVAIDQRARSPDRRVGPSV